MRSTKIDVRIICDHLKALKFSSTLPYVFTEHGTLMLASVLNTEIAIAASVQVVRAFVQLREMLTSHKDLAQKIQDLERKYDSKFKVVFDALKQLMARAAVKRKPIGFTVQHNK